MEKKHPEDGYLYFVKNKQKYVKGIYDYPLDLSTLSCDTTGYYVEKIKVTQGYPHGPYDHQTFSSYEDVYDEKNDRWFVYWTVFTTDYSIKDDDIIYIPGISTMESISRCVDLYKKVFNINVMFKDTVR